MPVAADSAGIGRNVSPKELARFIENDLTKEEQDKLSHITDKDEQHRELRRLFLQHRRAGESSTGAGGGDRSASVQNCSEGFASESGKRIGSTAAKAAADSTRCGCQNVRCVKDLKTSAA